MLARCHCFLTMCLQSWHEFPEMTKVHPLLFLLVPLLRRCVLKQQLCDVTSCDNLFPMQDTASHLPPVHYPASVRPLQCCLTNTWKVQQKQLQLCRMLQTGLNMMFPCRPGGVKMGNKWDLTNKLKVKKCNIPHWCNFRKQCVNWSVTVFFTAVRLPRLVPPSHQSHHDCHCYPFWEVTI